MATYKDSGVNIEAGENLIKSIKNKVAETYNENVLSSLGSFGGFYELPTGYKNPVLVSSIDGVGTKLKIAFLMNKHDTVGQCLVNHCVNDILVCGAKPLYFLDYFATGRLDPENSAQLLKGIINGCKENSCALIGGETAEMPGFYNDNEYDLCGTIVGIADKLKIIDGSTIQEGDVVIGLASNGLHTNGYSLARKILLAKYKVDTYIDELGCMLGEELLKVHKSYLHSIERLFDNIMVRGLAHITGGGLVSNTMRIIPENLKLDIDWKAWEEPKIFDIIRKEGNVPEEDMRRTFNLGIGLIVIVTSHDLVTASEVLNNCGEKTHLLGKIVKR